MPVISCDLLEKSYFCSITNNTPNTFAVSGCVVICLKNRTFAVSQTTVMIYLMMLYALWFAWKIVLLQYHKQPVARMVFHLAVVICLKNRTFAVSQTTERVTPCMGWQLWFAWKIVLLQYHKQRSDSSNTKRTGCDLLEKSYFCSITNNIVCNIQRPNRVVICLKNRTFAVSQTTGVSKHLLEWLLWFAWKIVLLQYHKQPDGGDIKLYCGCDLLEKSYFCSITNNFGADKR